LDRAHRAYTFRALSKTYGQMWLRCDICRRYARLKLAGLHDVDYRTRTFSFSVCGSEAYFCLVEPTTEFGMHDYRLDEVDKSERHPATTKRITKPSWRLVSSTDGELPGRKMDGRRYTSETRSPRQRLLW
jgi:hypothetical protein